VAGVLSLPSIAAGQEIRVLFLVPRQDVALAAQTARMERAILSAGDQSERSSLSAGPT
jgi:hypothetical protein